MDEDENENIFDEDEFSDDDAIQDIHPDDMSEAMRALNSALIDADDAENRLSGEKNEWNAS